VIGTVFEIDMLNLIEKFHALLVSDKVNVWHFPTKSEGHKFFFWLNSEPDNKIGYGFDTLEQMIDGAYAHIDPLRKPLPSDVPVPPVQA
jgi:hypothetical protein